MHLRTAMPGDLEDVMALETEVFDKSAWARESMAEELASEFGKYVVAEADGAIVGYAGLRVVGEDGDIQTICVAAGHRGLGIGRAMLEALSEEAERLGAARIFLEVRADNAAARHLYTDLGWQQIGVRRGYYQPENVDAITMRRHLP